MKKDVKMDVGMDVGMCKTRWSKPWSVPGLVRAKKAEPENVLDQPWGWLRCGMISHLHSHANHIVSYRITGRSGDKTHGKGEVGGLGGTRR